MLTDGPIQLGNSPNDFETALGRTPRIHFSLAGLDPDQVMADGNKGFFGVPGGGNVTNAELWEVMNNPEWFEKTTFYLDEKALPDGGILKWFAGQDPFAE